MGRLFFIRDRELVSSNISMSRSVVFSGGLETEECHFLKIGLEMNLY
jgi:hypothetical protein